MTPSPPRASSGVRHPLEDSDRLAWQATAAVGLLERFGDLLAVALEAAGDGDDAALAAALVERDRLVAQLEPLLAALAAARADAHAWDVARGRAPGPSGSGSGASGTGASGACGTAAGAIELILGPVDVALDHARHLHRRLADEAEGRTRPGVPPHRRPAALALVR